ncbi:N-myc-interactor-like [Acipenser oxyrinchus oxyrinchus]|uniref:N-myc-interactor-like n=1 Tax=Acipenser oxyrinchus oxyrinchus TaxID=40147 RepID=A0AAD8DB07_ACIOX|nr:N-myc-interactor-like [Acipenser oxyrinchus oxyrinchus]
MAMGTSEAPQPLVLNGDVTPLEELSPEDQEELRNLKKELEQLKTQFEKADTVKSRLLLDKLDQEEHKKQAQDEMMTLAQEEKDFWKALENQKQYLEQEALAIEETNHQLRQQINKQTEKLEFMRSESESLQQKFKITAAIPEKAVKFIGVEKEIPDHKLEEDCLHIQGQFSIIQNPALTLSGGQALITFEEEQVAERILKLARCPVTVDSVKMDVKPSHVALDTAVKFEVQLNVSLKKIEVSNIPPFLPEEMIRDKLELNFSKPSLGGGEVENVEYNKDSGTAVITFLHTGVVERLAMKKTYPFDMGHKVSEVFVSLCTEHRLKKFQTFCGTSRRTVLLSGISDVLDEEDLQDNLEIHFQKPNNYGGEVENIKYNAQGQTTVAYFNEETVGSE